MQQGRFSGCIALQYLCELHVQCSVGEWHVKIIRLQWNLRIKDTLGPAILSFVEEVVLF